MADPTSICQELRVLKKSQVIVFRQLEEAGFTFLVIFGKALGLTIWHLLGKTSLANPRDWSNYPEALITDSVFRYKP